MLTDLYQLTMLEAYLKGGMHDHAVFEYIVRTLPAQRAFLVSCGLESCLSFLQNVHFDDEEIDYLKSTRRFSPALIDYLKNFRFTGDVYAMPEGTIFFTDEPPLRVVAPIMEAQLVETRLINFLQFETLIASKAARCMLAADGKATMIDFGLRRTHGAEAGLLAARSSYIAGFIGTSTVLAEAVYGIPIFGTMAHSFIEAHETELEAFVQFCLANPTNTTLLIDTYDTLDGARNAVRAAKLLAEKDIKVQRVRLDSGDMLSLSKAVRAILDDAGCRDIQIFASGNMDEFNVRHLLANGAPIDGFGIGTKLDTSSDAPYLECAYKLTEYAGKPRMKKSAAKATMPGRKQVYRGYAGGIMTGDVLTIEGDAPVPGGVPLIEKVMAGGRRLAPAKTLPEITAYTRGQLSGLPVELRRLDAGSSSYPVGVSPSLRSLTEETGRSLR